MTMRIVYAAYKM